MSFVVSRDSFTLETNIVRNEELIFKISSHYTERHHQTTDQQRYVKLL